MNVLCGGIGATHEAARRFPYWLVLLAAIVPAATGCDDPGPYGLGFPSPDPRMTEQEHALWDEYYSHLEADEYEAAADMVRIPADTLAMKVRSFDRPAGSMRLTVEFQNVGERAIVIPQLRISALEGVASVRISPNVISPTYMTHLAPQERMVQEFNIDPAPPGIFDSVTFDVSHVVEWGPRTWAVQGDGQDLATADIPSSSE